MPRYTVTDPNTNKTLRLEGDSPPTEEELEEIFAGYAPKQPTGYQAPTFAEIGSGLVEDLSGARETLTSGVSGAIEDYQQGGLQFSEYQSPEATAAFLGVMEGVAPAAGEAIIGVGKAALSAATPDVIEEPFVNNAVKAFSAAGDFIMNNDWVGPVLNMAKESFADYNNWKNSSEENQRKARVLESTVDMAALVAPASKTKALTDGWEDSGRKMILAGDKKKFTNKREGVQSLLEPRNIGKAEGRVTEEGPLRTKTYNPTEYEQEAIDVVTGLPKINTSRSATYNMNIVEDEIGLAAQRLEKRIIGQGNPKVDTQLIQQELEKDLIALVNSDTFYGTKAVISNIQSMQRLANKLILSSDGTAVGLLNARKLLDRELKANAPAVYDADYENAKAAALRVIRQKINASVAEAVPQTDVLRQLKRQNLMFNALDTLTDKSNAEDLTMVARAITRLEKATGLNAPSSVGGLAVTAGLTTTALAYSGALPYIAGGGAVVGTMYALRAAQRSGTLKQALGATLTGLNQAIKTADGALLKQLKADRLAIIALMQDVREEEEVK
jgi:hypothetical protein